MGENVDIVVEDDRWTALGLEALAERATVATLAHLGIDPQAELSLLATDDARIAGLNSDFRGKASATNVLSWPSEDLAAEEPGGAPLEPEADFPGEPPFLGDIALAWETCAAEAIAADRPMTDHVTHLVVHGILHLLGYDHIRDPDAELMERLEVEILGELGLPDPY